MPTLTTRAVILARGLGTRMRRADDEAELDAEQGAVADAGVKGMIPIGRPFLDYVISALADAGITDVCLVIGPEHQGVRDHYDSATLERVRVHYAVQLEARGTADAVLAAREFADADTVLVLNSDNYYPVEAYRALVQLGGSGLVGFDRDALVAHGNIPEERILRFALVAVDEDGYLTEIVEKPDAETFRRMEPHALVSMNLWSFSPTIFEACAQVERSPRGEFELQDAVRIASRDLGERFRVIPLAAGVLDLSSRRDVAAVAAQLTGREVRL